MLSDENWSPSMQGLTGSRPRYICKICWTARQKRYTQKKGRDENLAQKRKSRAKRIASWSDDIKEKNRRIAYGNWLKRKYGITIECYEALYDLQGGKCKICSSEQPRGRGGFHVDHCHENKNVRGLLCASCNMMLGMAKDSKEILMNAIEYLAAGGKAY